MSDLLADLRSARSEEEREWLVMKFSLDILDPAVREVVWAAAIPRWFDPNFLASILNKKVDDGFERIFEKLVSLSFVEVFQGRGYNVHERSRTLLLKRLWENHRVRYQELNKRASQYCSEKTSSDTHWRISSVYHLLLANEANSVQQFVDQGTYWQNRFEYENLEALARPVVVEAEANRLTPRAVAWAHYFQGVADIIYSRYASAKKNLEFALATWPEEVTLKADILKLLANTHYIFDEYEKAREKLDEALRLYQESKNQIGEASTIKLLAHIDSLLGESHSARKKYQQALKLYRRTSSKIGESDCIRALGAIHSNLGEFKQARQKFNRALKLSREVGNTLGEANCIKSLGDTAKEVQDYDAALRYYEEALGLFRQLKNKLGEANSIAQLGELFLLQGDYHRAKERMEEAIKLHREIGDKLSEGAGVDMLHYIQKKLEEQTSNT